MRYEACAEIFIRADRQSSSSLRRFAIASLSSRAPVARRHRVKSSTFPFRTQTYFSVSVSVCLAVLSAAYIQYIYSIVLCLLYPSIAVICVCINTKYYATVRIRILYIHPVCAAVSISKRFNVVCAAGGPSPRCHEEIRLGCPAFISMPASVNAVSTLSFSFSLSYCCAEPDVKIIMCNGKS